MSRSYTVGAADTTTAAAAVPAAANKGMVVQIPDETERLDVPKALIDFANSLPFIHAVPLATTPPAAAGTAAVGAGTAAAREDHVHPSELPTHAAADSGKRLAVKADGTLEWVAVTAELPAHTAADADKLLAVKADGALEWRAHKTAPTWGDIKAGTVY